MNSSAAERANSCRFKSTAWTQYPSAFNRFTRWPPMKPPAPLTKMRFIKRNSPDSLAVCFRGIGSSSQLPLGARFREGFKINVQRGGNKPEIASKGHLGFAFRPLYPLGRNLDGGITEAQRPQQQFGTEFIRAVSPSARLQDFRAHYFITEGHV